VDFQNITILYLTTKQSSYT